LWRPSRQTRGVYRVYQDAPEEIDRFLDELSINVTHFFRDIEVFEAFRKGPLAELLQQKLQGESRLVRIWSAACASGQEPYSLAILLAEELRDKPR